MSTRLLDAGWTGMDGIFGGYVMATAVDLVRLDGFRPQSVTLAFVSTVRAGEVELVTEPLHVGRSSASLRLEIHQDGRLRAHGIGSMVRDDSAPTWEPPSEPAPPAPGEVAAYVPAHRPLPYLDRLEVRGLDEDSMEHGARAWVRSRAGATAELSTHARLALYLDVLPPGLFATEPRPAFVPSLDLTVHFSSRVGPVVGQADWFVVRNRTVWASDHYCVDEGTLHDRDDHLVAALRQGRQVRY